jgi:hypothetical protein
MHRPDGLPILVNFSGPFTPEAGRAQVNSARRADGPSAPDVPGRVITALLGRCGAQCGRAPGTWAACDILANETLEVTGEALAIYDRELPGRLLGRHSGSGEHVRLTSQGLQFPEGAMWKIIGLAALLFISLPQAGVLPRRNGRRTAVSWPTCRSNRKQPFRFGARLYKLRWRIEAASNGLKDFRTCRNPP